ncbi:helix-turn-helix transcriptional regulator [Streptomyces sp. NPDC007971]|uniref:helix-turn-helix transcriptional regulator n=1 Tax=Streptomyces sp. NPDC007971 TaxID=3364799 RepID=UPI0036EF3BAB
MAHDDAYARLAETLKSLHFAAGGPERLAEAEAVDVAALSLQTGIERHVVAALLGGGRAEETSVPARVRGRLDFLRVHYLRKDGKPYSQQELAAIAGVTRQTLSEWYKRGLPSLEAAERLRQFFNLTPGFFTTDEPTALNLALVPVLQELERKSDPLGPLRTKAMYRLARRAPSMPDGALEGLLYWAERITRPQDGAGGAARGPQVQGVERAGREGA